MEIRAVPNFDFDIIRNIHVHYHYGKGVGLLHLQGPPHPHTDPAVIPELKDWIDQKFASGALVQSEILILYGSFLDWNLAGTAMVAAAMSSLFKAVGIWERNWQRFVVVSSCDDNYKIGQNLPFDWGDISVSAEYIVDAREAYGATLVLVAATE